MKQRSSNVSADLQIVIDNKDESLESSDPYKRSKAKLKESKQNFDPKFESYSKLKPINRKDGMPGTLRPSETLQGKNRKQSKVAAKNRDMNLKSQREKSQEAVKAKPLTKKPRLMSASVNSSHVVGVSLAKVKPKKGSKKKLKQNNLMAKNFKNLEDKRKSQNKSQLDLQTESGQAHVDRNELKAAKFEIANQNITRDPSQDFKLFYANYSSSPTSGWGHLVENQHGLNLQDRPFDASQNEIHVVNTLSGSEGYPIHYKQRDRDPNKSDFENNFKSAKNCLYDGGIIQSYCPQQFESPQMQIEISKIQNLDEIMKNIDAQSGQSTTPVDRQSSKKTEVIEQPLIEKSLNQDFQKSLLHELQQQKSEQHTSNVQLQSNSDPQTATISIDKEIDNNNSQIRPSIIQSTQDLIEIDEKPAIIKPKQSIQSQVKAEDIKVVSLQPHNPIQKREVKLQSDTYTQEFQIQETPRVQPIVNEDPQIVTLVPFYAIQKKDIKLFSDTYTQEFEIPATPQPIQLPKCTAVTRQLSQSAVLESEEQIIEEQSSFNDYQALEDLHQQLQKGQKFTKKVAFVEPIEEIDIHNKQQDANISDILDKASGPLPINSSQELINDELQGEGVKDSEKLKNDESDDEESYRSQDFQFVIATLPIITAVSKRFEFIRYHMCDSKSQEKDMLEASSDQLIQVIVQIPSITAINGSIVKKSFHQDSGFIFESPINPDLSKIDPILPEKGSGEAIREDQSAQQSENITETASARFENELGSNHFPVYSALQIPAKFPKPMLSQTELNPTPKSNEHLSLEQSSPREEEAFEVISYKDSPVIREKSRLQLVSSLKDPIRRPMQSGSPESEERVSSINDYKALEDLQKQMFKGQELKNDSVQDPESSQQSLMSSTDSKFMEKKTLVTLLIAQQCQNSGVSFDLDALSNKQIQKMEISEIKQVVEQYIQGKDRSNLNQAQSQFYYKLEQIDQTESQNQDVSEQQISIVEQDQNFNIVEKIKGAAKTDLQRNEEKKTGNQSTENGDIFESEVEGAAESEEAKELEDIESFEQSPQNSTRDQPGVNMIQRRQKNIEIEVTIENKEDQVNDQQVIGFQNVINPLMIQADQMNQQKKLQSKPKDFVELVTNFSRYLIFNHAKKFNASSLRWPVREIRAPIETRAL